MSPRRSRLQCNSFGRARLQVAMIHRRRKRLRLVLAHESAGVGGSRCRAPAAPASGLRRILCRLQAWWTNSAAGAPRASAISNSRSYNKPRRPNSSAIRTVHSNPLRSANCSWVNPCSMRNCRMLSPTERRRRAHCSTRHGSFWLGRVGTYTRHGHNRPKV